MLIFRRKSKETITTIELTSNRSINIFLSEWKEILNIREGIFSCIALQAYHGYAYIQYYTHIIYGTTDTGNYGYIHEMVQKESLYGAIMTACPDALRPKIKEALPPIFIRGMCHKRPHRIER